MSQSSFPQFNSPTSSSGQCTTRGFFSLISFGGDGGFICLWDESAACYDLRSNNEEKLMNRTAEHRDYLGWNLLNWDSSHFAVISGSFVRTEREGSSRYISAAPWCAGAASGSAIRTGIPMGAAVCADISLLTPECELEHRSTLELLLLPSQAPGVRRAPLEAGNWVTLLQPQHSLGWIRAGAVPFPGWRSDTRIARSRASHRHRGWVKILIYFNAAIEAF